MLRRALQIAVMAGALGAVQAQASDYLLYWQVEDSAAITWFDGSSMGTVADYTNLDGQQDRKSTRLNSSHTDSSRMPSSA